MPDGPASIDHARLAMRPLSEEARGGAGEAPRPAGQVGALRAKRLAMALTMMSWKKW